MNGINIASIELLDDYQLGIILCNSHRIIYNLKPKLNTIRFIDISDQHIYKNAVLIHNRIIRWNDNTEITLGEILADITNKKEYINRTKGVEMNDTVKKFKD